VLGGQLFCEPAPRPYHQVVVQNLILHGHAQKQGLGVVLLSPLDVVLSETDVVEPDLLFIPLERLEILREEAVRGAPSWVAEVVSPSTAERDRSSPLLFSPDWP